MSRNHVAISTEMVPVTFEVASSEFLRSHSELHHYTNAAGLAGILESQSLWATHFEDLNDSTEVMLLRDHLSDAMAKRFIRLAAEKARGSLSIRRQFERSGGLYRNARGFAEDLTDALYKTTFKNDEKPPMGVPYVTSFCSHREDKDYERRSGLLSQWRGYGGEGGFCVVFDAVKLADMLSSEFERRYWIHQSIGSAMYATDDNSVESAFPELLDRCDRMISPVIEGKTTLEPESDMFVFLVTGATRFKHQGFREEREVRIVAIPGTQDIGERVLAAHPEWKMPELVPLRERRVGMGSRRYLSLFEGSEQRLPIKRVIVGPSIRQQAQLEEAQRLLGGLIKVERSETPFIG